MKLNRRKFIKTSAAVAAASALARAIHMAAGSAGAGRYGEGRHPAFADRHHRHRRKPRWSTRRSWRSRRSTPRGGVMGKKIEVIVEDGASDWPTFAEKARKLLEKDKVAAIFGCYTSASRKAVLPVMERYKGLLYYPTYYEGLEMSPNIMYTAQEGTQSAIASHGLAVQEQGQELLPDRLGLHLAAHDEQDRQAAHQEDRRQGGGRKLLPAGLHRVRLRDQQDQGGQARRDLEHAWWAAATSRSTSSSTAAGITGKNQTLLCAWRCPRKRRPGSVRKTSKASCPAWATSRA